MDSYDNVDMMLVMMMMMMLFLVSVPIYVVWCVVHINTCNMLYFCAITHISICFYYVTHSARSRTAQAVSGGTHLIEKYFSLNSLPPHYIN